MQYDRGKTKYLKFTCQVYCIKCITVHIERKCDCSSWLPLTTYELPWKQWSAKSTAKLTPRINSHTQRVVYTYPGKFRSTKPLTHISLITVLWHKMIGKEKESELKKQSSTKKEN